MSDLTKEQFEELPEFLKKDYSEVEGVYKNIAVMTIKKTANDLDAKLKTSISAKLAQDEQLQAFNELKEKEIREAREQGIEEATRDNKPEIVLKLEREKLADQEKIINEKMVTVNELMAGIATDKKTVIADRLTKSAKEGFEDAFNTLILDLIDINVKTREKTFLNVDGSASSITDDKEFIEYLGTQKLFKALIKGTVTTTGAGLANGGLDGSASKIAPKDMTGKQRMEWKLQDPIAFKKHFNL